MDNQSLYISQNEFARLLGVALGKKSPVSAPSMRKYRKEVAGFPNCTASPLTRISYLRSEVEEYINILTHGQ